MFVLNWYQYSEDNQDTNLDPLFTELMQTAKEEK